MTSMRKQIKNVAEIDDKLAKKIDVLCYGHFNVLHPGHFRFISFAATKGTTLAVLLQSDSDIEESDRNQYFSQIERAGTLQNLSMVDYVFVRGAMSLSDCIEKIRPEFFVLGSEFEHDQSDDVKSIVEKCRELSIDVVFHSGDRHVNQAYSFLNLTNSDTLHAQAEKQFSRVLEKNSINASSLIEEISSFSNVRTLVVGDLIVDQYVATEPIGVSAEAPIIVVKELEEQTFVGGAAIVASNVVSLGANCELITVTGDDLTGKLAMETLKERGVQTTAFVDENRPTTLKKRYLAGQQKIFRTSRLLDTKISSEIEGQIVKRIEATASSLDNIIVSDFVYGVVTEGILAAIKDVAKKNKIKVYGDLQCSSQIGNVLKFRNFEAIFPTEKEARIALDNKDDGLEYVAQRMLERSNCQALVLKLGEGGFITYSKVIDGSVDRVHFPALSVRPVDVSGAGDSLLALMATSLAAGLGLHESAAIAAVAASISVETVGNSPVDPELLKTKLMSFVF